VGKLLAGLATFGLGIAIGSGAWAQDDKREAGNQGQNQKQGRDQDRDRSGVQTIRGVVSAIAAEGEMVVDYRTNQAVMVQAAYLTVVGSPTRGQEGASDASARPGGSNRQDQEQAGRDRSGKGRENIYIVFLSPRTKVYAASGDSGRSEQKKEVPLDLLEVGDRVEVQLAPRAQSGTNAEANQTEKMRRTHGRHRTYIGDAMAITIQPPKSGDDSSSGSQGTSRERSDRPNREK